MRSRPMKAAATGKKPAKRRRPTLASAAARATRFAADVSAFPSVGYVGERSSGSRSLGRPSRRIPRGPRRLGLHLRLDSFRLPQQLKFGGIHLLPPLIVPP